jgi:hypothetical protein
MSAVLFNVITFAASIVALTTSIVFALRQSRLMGYANDIPITIHLFDESRSPEFVRRERYVWTALAGESSPDQGFQGMPDHIYEPVYNVCVYYQMVALLVAFGRLDSRLTILPLHYRVVKTWSVVKPYVEGERALRGDRYSFLNFFEDFAVMCENTSHRDLYLNVRRQAFLRHRWFRGHHRSSVILDTSAMLGDEQQEILSRADSADES